MGGKKQFCPVCREQMVLAIHGVVSPIDRATPHDDPVSLERGQVRTFFVEVLEPAEHTLEVEWRLAAAPGLEEVQVVKTFRHPGAAPPFCRLKGRHLPPLLGRILPASPGERTQEGTRLHRLHLHTGDLSPRMYCLTVRVRDRTPWVIKDSLKLMEARRMYRIEVVPGR